VPEDIRSSGHEDGRYRPNLAWLDALEYATLGAAGVALLAMIANMVFGVPHWTWLDPQQSLWLHLASMSGTLRLLIERWREYSTDRARLTRHEWRYLLTTLTRQFLFGIPSLLMPRGERHDWMRDVRESFDYRGDQELSVWAVIGSHIVAFPHTLVAMWADRLAGKAAVLDLDEQPVTCKTGPVRRFLREARFAILFAILGALLMEPVMYLLTYWLHLHGMIWPWEYWFPME
jgi:hypothetical protein